MSLEVVANRKTFGGKFFFEEKIIRKFFAVVLGVLFTCGLASFGHCEVEFKSVPDFFESLKIGGEFTIFYRTDENALFTKDKDYGWGETVVKLWGTAEIPKDILVNVGIIHSATISTSVYDCMNFYYQDAFKADEGDWYMDTFYLSFRELLGGPVSLTLGRQKIMIEKQFLIGDGASDLLGSWLMPRVAFPLAARMDLDLRHWQITGFYARADKCEELHIEKNLDLAGINVHYDYSGEKYFYGGYYVKPEYGPNTFDLGADLTWNNFNLSMEVAYQTGWDHDAWAGYIVPKYTFTQVKHTPWISVGYLHFDGDEPDTADVEEWDPFYFGFVDWGQWYMGEVVGATTPPIFSNYNYSTIYAQCGINLTERCTFRLMVFNFTLDQDYMGEDDFANEFDFIIGYAFNDNLYGCAVFAIADPKNAGELMWGDEKAYQVETFLMFSF
jgi:hypothetical protein